jgi:hypothetical protein
MTRVTPALPTLRLADNPLRCQRLGCAQLAVLEIHGGARGFWSCVVGHDGWVRLRDPDVTPPESRYPAHGLPCNCGCGRAVEPERSLRGGPTKYRLDCARRRELERNHKRAPEKLARKYPHCEACGQRIWRHAKQVDNAWRHTRCLADPIELCTTHR